MDSPSKHDAVLRPAMTDLLSLQTYNDLSYLWYDVDKEDDDNKEDTVVVEKEDEENKEEDEEEDDPAAKLQGWDSAHLLFLKTSFEDIPLIEDSYVIQDAKAYSFLEIALVKGDVTEHQMNFFKGKFNLLAEAYRTSRALVHSLCEKIVAAQETLKEHRSLEEVFNSLPETTPKRTTDKETEQLVNAAELRMQLLTFRNKLQLYDEQSGRVEHVLRFLREERDQLQVELERMDKHADNEKAFKMAIRDVQGLDVEVLNTKRQLEQVKSNVEMVDKNVALENQKFSIKIDIIKALERDLSDAKTKRKQQQKFFEEAFRRIQETETRIVKANAEMKTVYPQLRAVAAQVNKTVAQLAAATRTRQREEARLEQRQLELQEMEHKMAALKAQTAENKEVRAQLAHELRLNVVLRRQAEENRVAALRNRDNRHCMLQTAQHKLKEAEQQLMLLSVKHKRLNCILENCPHENKKLSIERKKMSDELQALNQKLLKENFLTTIEVDHYERLSKAVLFLQSEMWGARKHLRDLTLDRARLACDKLSKSSTHAKMEQRLEQLRNEQKVLAVRQTGLAKTLRDLELKADALNKRVDAERNDRNQDYRLMLLEQQKLVECKERVKVMDTEVKNLLQLYEQRVRQLQKVQARLVVERAARDALRAERLSVTHDLKQCELEHEATEVLANRARRGVVVCRRYGVMARDEFNACVNERNVRALQLRDRTEEAVIFTEKMKTCEDMLKRADCEYNQRVEVVGRLRTVMLCEQEDVHLLRRRTSDRSDLAGTVDTLSCELYHITHKEVVLEKVFESGTRHRLIGDGPAVRSEMPDQLKEKYFALERRVKAKEMRLVEIKLLQGQIARITATLQRDVPSSLKDGQLATQAKVNVQTKTDDSSRRMKALVCETALARTTLRALQQQLETRRAELQEARGRMECGEAPTESASREWDAMERLRTYAPRVLPTETHMPSPRPTAYIPNVQGRMVLPLPRPYGAQAPFKPFPPTPHLRHYRAPGEGARTEAAPPTASRTAIS